VQDDDDDDDLDDDDERNIPSSRGRAFIDLCYGVAKISYIEDYRRIAVTTKMTIMTTTTTTAILLFYRPTTTKTTGNDDDEDEVKAEHSAERTAQAGPGRLTHE
jgi:hypothetical protein